MKIEQVAVILYTLRDFCKTPADIAKTLKKVSDIGYTSVQVSGVGEIAEEELNKMLADNGLTCCATHEDSDEIRQNPEKVIEHLQKLNCAYTAYPFPKGIDFAKEEDWTALIQDLEKAGEKMAAAGITLCYHNHHQEFVQFKGKTALELIYEGASPTHLQGELDTYWVQFGGGNPVDWVKKMSGRTPLLHLKDFHITSEGKQLFCEIGNGTLDFPSIVKAADEGGCKWFIVEQDVCPGDPFDSIKISFDYIKNNLVS